ncbi:primosomal protein N' [Paraneptunicella aestuarii]|uniref:primosomal protein N' n=1 Tax=Paraneptunicella aestuarii TaxID=2831148 RepID=UPI001E33CBF9|nr:primosomal protein N' [Paraneptunicella aestuarii]UAA40681.1 primosomal protein N' [Paraneptunicella aestuarii]
MANSILEVALPVPMRRVFDYLCPESLCDVINIGSRVAVSFGHRQLIGIVVATKSESEWQIDKLKPIRKLLDDEPVIDEALFTLLNWASKYYHHPIGEVLTTAIPARLRKGEANERPGLTYWQATDEGMSADLDSLKRAAKQQQLLQKLQQGRQPESLLREHYSPQIFTGLRKKAFIESLQVIPALSCDWAQHIEVSDKPFASKEQAVVISALKQQTQQFSVSLIEGVTGSGKTEVYLQAIEPILMQGVQVLVLVPEIGLTPQTVSRFQHRFQIEVGVLHSGMTDNERLSVWQRAKAGDLGIVIGTRSAVFTPFNKLGMIIIDEEHDSSYKQADGLRYHARDMAVMRAKQLNIPLLLGSATPSLESLHNARQKRYRHFQLHQRAGNALHTHFHTLDLRQQPLQFGLAPGTIKQIRHHLEQGNQVLIFLNRRGYAPALLCHECGHVELCGHCERPYTMHKQMNQLHCHHCGHSKGLPRQCSECHSKDIAPLGMGTEQLEQGIQQMFPQYSAIRIDSDTMRAKSRLNQILDDIQSGEHQLLIGTQILAKGHHFPNVTLVVVVDIDGALFSADYRSAEQLAQLITQIAGRAGRASKPGEMWLQSHHPGHPLIEDLLHNGYGHFARQLLLERQHANLPPFSYQVLIRAESAEKQAAYDFLLSLCRSFRETPLQDQATLQAIGPLPALLEKRQGRYRFQLILQSQGRAPLHEALQRQLAMMESHPLASKVRWSVDIDPQEFY